MILVGYSGVLKICLFFKNWVPKLHFSARMFLAKNRCVLLILVIMKTQMISIIARPMVSIAAEVSQSSIAQLSHFLASKQRVMCITGAGVSTSSGIPDYRGPQGSYKKGHKPIVHSEFLASHGTRQRYWGRSIVGWKSFAKAMPNDCHIALSLLQKHGYINTIITQNVDRLHQRAGAKNVVDLHGRNDVVSCLNSSCSYEIPREILQDHLHNINLNGFISSIQESGVSIRSDGDAELGSVNYNEVLVPSCPHCQGILKPKVVFFGDNVPSTIVQGIYEQVNNSDGLLIIGTSLEVFSAYRFVERANSLGIPIVIVNQGPTRAERNHLENIIMKIDGNCSIIMKDVVNFLSV